MERDGVVEDAGDSASGPVTSESVTLEEQQISSARVCEDSDPGTTEIDAVVDSDKEKVVEPSSEVSKEVVVEVTKLSEVVTDAIPVVESDEEKNAGETSEDGRKRVEAVSSPEIVDDPCEDKSKSEVSEISKVTPEKQTIEVVESSDAPDDNPPSGDEVRSVIVDEVTHDSSANTVCENSELGVRLSGTSTTLDENVQDDTIASKRAKLEGKDDTSSSDVSGTVIDSKCIKPTEKSGAECGENDIEVIAEGPSVGTVTEGIVKDAEKSEIVEDFATPRKRARVGRPRKNSRPSEIVLENGSPEGEVHLDESNLGRPRRKAAQKAGDQIKDAVNLPRRPFMHCTTLVIIMSLFAHFVVKLSHLTSTLHATMKRVDWLFFMASISHHIRDGSRRGLWLWPLPFWSSGKIYSTPPISKVLYLICTMALPHLLKCVITEAVNPSSKTDNLLIV